MVRLFAASLAVLLSAKVIAADDIHIGVGLESCGSWLHHRAVLQDRQSPDRQRSIGISNMIESWVQGFAVATALAVDVLTDHTDEAIALRRVPDADSIAAWIDKYCREQPLKTIEDAAIGLTRELNVNPK